MSVAMRLEQKVSTYIRKWLHLHQPTTNLCFYSSTSPCPLPINSLTSILKSCKISGHLLLRDSKDPLVAASNPVLQSGGSWKVKDAVRSAESELAFQTIRGPPQFGRAGLSQEAKLQERPKNQSCCTYLLPGQPIYFWKAYSMGNTISAVVRHLEWQKFFFRPSTIDHCLHFPDILWYFYITDNHTLYNLNNL